LLAGDTDGSIWFFRNQGEGSFSIFAPGQKLRVGDAPLSLADSGGTRDSMWSIGTTTAERT
jgi:hypothetical protein